MCIRDRLYASLYLFLPLMAVNTIFTYRAGGFSVSNRPAAAPVSYTHLDVYKRQAQGENPD